MIGDRVEIIAVPATRGVNPFAIDTSVRRTVVDTVENDYRYELEEGEGVRRRPRGAGFQSGLSFRRPLFAGC